MLNHDTMYTAMGYSEEFNTIPGLEAQEFSPSSPPLSFIRVTPQIKQQLMALAIALLTGQMTNGEAIATVLEAIAAKLRGTPKSEL